MEDGARAAAATAAALLVAALLHSHLTGAATTARAAALPPATGCSTAIIEFSPCLPYVSLPPNDLDSSVPPWCCTAYSSVLRSGSGVCLCYLLREPSMLGFPLNNSRLVSLSLDCSRLNSTFGNRGSLESLCSASPPLPPLRSGSGGSIIDLAPDIASISSPEASPPLDYAASSEPAPSYAPEPADMSPESSEEPPAYSSAAEHFHAGKRSRLLGGSVNTLLTIIIGRL